MGLPSAVAAYYEQAPSPQRETMLAIRELVLEVLPDADEVMKYAMPTFVHGGTAVAGLMANARHVGYYPYSGSVLAGLPRITAKYRTTTGSVHVPPDAPLLKSEVRALIKARLAEAAG